LTLVTAAHIRNHLLAGLAHDGLAALTPRLARVALTSRQIVYAADQPIDAVYFLESGMVSLICAMDDGMQAEAGNIGNEGMLGASLLSGESNSYVDAVVQMPGTALRMGADAFRHELAANALLRACVSRYRDGLMAQVMQNAACNGHHGIEQRLARQLLMAHDRTPGGDLKLTQEFLATMLGVHRPSITVVASNLQRAGLIRYGNGHISILDRAGLEAASCECYGAVRRRFATLFGSAPIICMEHD
jgi:CRP-like cAMP-binding protein